MADKIKLTFAFAFIAAGVVSFHYFSDKAAYLRLLMVLAGLGLSAAIAWQTELGRRFFVFAKEAKDETKKVVWPTRKEALQTTAMVFLFVVIMAIFLWVVDKGLEWVLYDQLLGWSR